MTNEEDVPQPLPLTEKARSLRPIEDRAIARCAVREFIPQPVPEWILAAAEGDAPEITTYWRLEAQGFVAWAIDRFFLTGKGWRRLQETL